MDNELAELLKDIDSQIDPNLDELDKVDLPLDLDFLDSHAFDIDLDPEPSLNYKFQPLDIFGFEQSK